MKPYIFDVNKYIQSDEVLREISSIDGREGIPIYPLVGYEDSESPFILYWWIPGTLDKERYFVNVDFMRYHIVDVDADRGMRIVQRLSEILNKGDDIQGLISSEDGRALWSVLLRSGVGAFNAGLGAPREREGFYEFQLNFEVGYVPLP